MSNKNYTSEYVISLLRSVLNTEELVECPSNIDWEHFLTITKEHHLENIVCHALKKTKSRPPKFVADYLNSEYVKSIMRVATQQAETECIINHLTKNEIPFLPLKGYYLKNYYPSSDMRFMSDFDVYIGTDNADKVRDILENLGYTFEFCGKVHDNYIKKPIMHIEVHKHLMDDDMKSIAYYYDSFDAFSKAERSTDNPFEYMLSKNDFYIYMIAHTAKHYFTYGTGITSIMDAYLYVKNNDLDYYYIESELKKINLNEFNKKILALAELWFGNGQTNDELKEMGEYIISSGSYGKTKNEVLNAFVTKSKSSDSLFKKKIKYFFFMMFPNVEYLSGKYPKLKDKPYLLPLYWIRRFFSSIFRNRKAINLKLFTVFRAKKKEIDFHTQKNKD